MNNTTRDEWKIVDKFDSAYWSGLDAKVYFNNIEITEAIQVNYMISEQIRPYYGYAAYTASRIHHGARLIQGEISMNYKRDGYLFSLLSLIRQQTENNVWLTAPVPDASAEKRVPVEYNNTPYGPDLWNQLKNNTITPELANHIANKKRDSSESAVLERSPDINLRSGIFETKLEGFDVNIVFGSQLDSAQTLRWVDEENYDISATQHGESWVAQGKAAIASTGIKLIGVSIAGIAKTVNDDGRPLIETYSFQARDLVVLKNVDTIGIANAKENVLHSPVKSNSELDYSNGQIGIVNPMFPSRTPIMGGF